VSNTSKPQSRKERKEKKGGEERRRRREEVNFGAEAFLFQAAITGSDLNILDASSAVCAFLLSALFHLI
jgi:hypothetical protein